MRNLKFKVLAIVLFTMANITLITVDTVAHNTSYEMCDNEYKITCPSCNKSEYVRATGGYTSWGYTIYECQFCGHIFYGLPLEGDAKVL